MTVKVVDQRDVGAVRFQMLAVERAWATWWCVRVKVPGARAFYSGAHESREQARTTFDAWAESATFVAAWAPQKEAEVF